jgi:hypothetical protein
MHLDRSSIESDIISVSKSRHFSYCGFASDMGIPVGQVPKRFTTSLGNRLDFILERASGEQFEYRQVAGCVTLVVYND